MSDSVSFITAFAAGFISFISPCVLPLVPVYLTTMTGLTLEDLQRGDKKLLWHVFLSSLSYCFGFSVVFVMLGLTATTLGAFLVKNIRLFEIIAGGIIIVFGLHMSGVLKINFLYRTFQLGPKAAAPSPGVEKRRGFASYLRSFFIGAAFAFGWTPCVGPILAVVLTLAAVQESVRLGGLLLAVYSAGLAIPFILAGLLFGTFMSTYKNFRRHLHAVEICSGIFLVLFGLLLITHQFTVLAAFFSRLLPEPEMLLK